MIFFTISGFLITRILLHEKLETGSIKLKNFFIRRFLRLAPPLFLFFITIGSFMYFHLIPTNFLSLGFSFFYLYNYIPLIHYTPELGHTWSLGVEEQFYLLWGFLLFYVKKVKVVILFSITLIIFCLIWKTLYSIPINYGGKDHFLMNCFYIERWFIPACLPIIIGSLSSILFTFKNDIITRSLFKNKLVFFLSILLFINGLLIPYASETIIHFVQMIGVALFLVWILTNQESKLVSFLEMNPIAFIGKISYGLYVYQGLFLSTGPGGKLIIQHYPLNIILLVIVTLLSYYFVEKRVLRMRDGLV